jgi:flagellar basal-body rod modification protein FlgD
MRIESTQQNAQTASVVKNRAELGKNEFMNILVTQLRFQDPLRPMDDREFIAQMAQFTALEQMQNLNSEFAKSKAINMVGNFVTARIQGEGLEPELLRGLVESVIFDSGRTNVVINGQTVDADDIVSVHMQGVESYTRGNQTGSKEVVR